MHYVLRFVSYLALLAAPVLALGGGSAMLPVAQQAVGAVPAIEVAAKAVPVTAIFTIVGENTTVGVAKAGGSSDCNGIANCNPCAGLLNCNSDNDTGGAGGGATGTGGSADGTGAPGTGAPSGPANGGDSGATGPANSRSGPAHTGSADGGRAGVANISDVANATATASNEVVIHDVHTGDNNNTLNVDARGATAPVIVQNAVIQDSSFHAPVFGGTAISATNGGNNLVSDASADGGTTGNAKSRSGPAHSGDTGSGGSAASGPGGSGSGGSGAGGQGGDNTSIGGPGGPGENDICLLLCG